MTKEKVKAWVKAAGVRALKTVHRPPLRPLAPPPFLVMSTGLWSALPPLWLAS